MQLAALLRLMIKPLTSLRFLFAFMVFGWHCPFYTNPESIGYKISRQLWGNGYVGVSFFFILSGFILSLNYANYLRDEGISRRDFWLMRFARIYPLYLLTLLVEIPFTMHEYHADASVWWARLLTCAGMMQSWVPIEGWVTAFNMPSWSLSTEAFFYAIFPLLVLRIRGVRSSVLLSLGITALVLTGMLVLPSSMHKLVFYYNPLGRLGEFILGILLYRVYEVYSTKQWTYQYATFLEVASVVTFLIFYCFHWYVPAVFRISVYYWGPMTLLLYVFARSSGGLSRALGAPLMVLLGEASFAFYMIHYRTGGLLKIANRRFLHIDQASLLYFLLYFLGTLGTAIAVYLFFERPVNQYLRRKLLSVPRIAAFPLGHPNRAKCSPR
jgi:peptidoglycan/LPS O-acetylase OafA/YrhL